MRSSVAHSNAPQKHAMSGHTPAATPHAYARRPVARDPAHKSDARCRPPGTTQPHPAASLCATHTHATPTYGAGACTSTPATHTAPGSTQVVLTSGCVHDVGSWCTHRKQPRKAERGGGKQRSGDEKEGCVLRWVHGGRPSVQSWKPVSSVFRQPCRGVTAPHVLIGCGPASPTVTQR